MRAKASGVLLLLAAILGVPGCGRRGPASGPDPGVWAFESYQASEWEQEWRRGEESGERRDRECEFLAQPDEEKRSIQLLRAVRGLVLHGTPVPPESLPLFSRMVYALRRGPDLEDTGRRRVQLIEPLVGILRDPLTICDRPPGVTDDDYYAYDLAEGPVQSKRHLLIGPAAPWTDTPEDPASWRIGGFAPWADASANPGPSCPGRSVLLDMGASLYDEWHCDPFAASTIWFVDRFKRRRLVFDWIVAFEIEKYDPEEIYRRVPDDVLPHYVYFNRGIEKAPDGRWNPWRILRAMGFAPDDYVVAKLDIDEPEIEDAIIRQLLDDPRLLSLVDEMFFEHHVNVRAMWPGWGQTNAQTMLDSYRLFAGLRSKGVRMHSWP
jgi:hypothetical protein